MCIYKDGTHLATASNDKTVKLIDTQTLEVLKVYQFDRPANAVALSPIFDQVCITGHAMQGHVTNMLEACMPIALHLLDAGISSNHRSFLFCVLSCFPCCVSCS